MTEQFQIYFAITILAYSIGNAGGVLTTLFLLNLFGMIKNDISQTKE